MCISTLSVHFKILIVHFSTVWKRATPVTAFEHFFNLVLNICIQKTRNQHLIILTVHLERNSYGYLVFLLLKAGIHYMTFKTWTDFNTLGFIHLLSIQSKLLKITHYQTFKSLWTQQTHTETWTSLLEEAWEI